MRDYHNYRLSLREGMIEAAKAAGIVFVLGMLFFRSIPGTVLLIPYGIRLFHQFRTARAARLRNQLRGDFKDVVLSIAASLQAGYTLEQAVPLAKDELRRLYPEERRAMLDELDYMENSIKIQISVEQLMKNLAARSGIEEIGNFATVLSVARRQGGNLVKISRNTADHISRKIQMEEQVEQILAGKILEKNIMVCMPYLILIYLEITNRGYLDILYQGLTGRAIMCACLLAVITAGEWADRIACFRI